MAKRTVSDTKASATISSGGTDTTGSWVSGTGLGSWVGFHVFISAGNEASGQVRYGQTSGGTDLLYVSEPWATDPVTGNVYQAYNQDDLDADWGNDFKLVLKTNFEWAVAATDPDIGNGTDISFVGLVNNALDNDMGWSVSALGVFSMGKRFTFIGENPTDGLYSKGNNDQTASGYSILNVASGGVLDFNDVKMWSVYSHRWNFEEGSNVRLNKVVSFSNTYGSQFNGDMYGEDLQIIGNGYPGDIIYCSSGMNTYGGPIKLSNTYGLYFPSGHSNPSGQTIHVNNFVNIGNTWNVWTGNNTIWHFYDPDWGVESSATSSVDAFINWTVQNGPTTNVAEYNGLNITVTDTDGSALSSLPISVGSYGGPRTGAGITAVRQPHYFETDASGISEDYVRYAQYVLSGLAPSRFDPFIVRIFDYDKQTFETTEQDMDNKLDLVVTMLSDVDVVSDLSAATGFGISIEYDPTQSGGPYDTDWETSAYTSAHQVVNYTSAVGTDALSAGMNVINATSTVSGIVVEALSASTSAGKMVTSGMSGSWVQDDDIEIQGEQSARAYADTSAFHETYQFLIHASGQSIQNVYDYCKAYMATATSAVGAETWISGARIRHSQLIHKPSENFSTEEAVSAGVWVADYGAGNWDYLTSDQGTQYVPPSQVTLEINGVETTEEPTNYVRCHIEALSGGPEVSGTILLNDYADTADGLGTYKATAAYQYGGDQPVIIRARYAGYIPFKTNGIINSDGITITAIWIPDLFYTP